MRLSERDGKPSGSLRGGVLVQARSIYALLIRDVMQRYGRDNLGFGWVILEPMILTVGVTVVWSAIRQPYEHGVKIVALVLTGYMPLTLWRHLSNGGVFIGRRSLGLMYHRSVTMMDAFLAKEFTEFIGTSAAFLIVYSTLVVSGLLEPMSAPDLAIAGWLLMAWLSFGLATIFAAMTEYNEVMEHFIQPFQYLMLPVSGTFFMVYWLPTYAQELILYNPFVHCFELVRAGFFGDQVVTYYSAWYVALWGLALTAIGLWGMNAVRDRIHF